MELIELNFVVFKSQELMNLEIELIQMDLAVSAATMLGA